MLRKILEKAFITKKCTQCKRSHTKVCELIDNKNIGILFSKYETFSWIKLIPVLVHLKYWYYNTPSIELPCLPLYLCQLSPWPTETSLQHNPQSSSCSSSVSIFCFTQLDHTHKYWMYQIICQAKALKVFIKLYTDHKNSWVKHTTHQKAESFRVVSISKLNNIVNSNLIFNTNCAEMSTK